MKLSKVVVANLVMGLTYVSLLTAAYLGFASLSKPLMVALIVVNVVTSEVLNKFFPSGEYVGNSSDWSGAKWLMRIAMFAIAVLNSLGEQEVIPAQVVTAILPLFEIFMRVKGGASTGQVAAYRMVK